MDNEKKVDLRGLVCPEPVLRTKKLLDDQSLGRLEALVESDVNVKNLERLARSQKVEMESEAQEDYFRVVLTRSERLSDEKSAERKKEGKSDKDEEKSQGTGTVVFLAKDTFGEGDRDFSNSLLNVFLQTMLDSGHKPRAILMANTGVRLMDPDSPTLTVLQDFRKAGCDVFACGLCVDFYGLKGKIPANQITNMFAICEFLMTADKIVSP